MNFMFLILLAKWKKSGIPCIKNPTDPIGLVEQYSVIEQLRRSFYRFSLKSKFN